MFWWTSCYNRIFYLNERWQSLISSHQRGRKIWRKKTEGKLIQQDASAKIIKLPHPPFMTTLSHLSQFFYSPQWGSSVVSSWRRSPSIETVLPSSCPRRSSSTSSIQTTPQTCTTVSRRKYAGSLNATCWSSAPNISFCVRSEEIEVRSFFCSGKIYKNIHLKLLASARACVYLYFPSVILPLVSSGAAVLCELH